jgi:hypothetical protein
MDHVIILIDTDKIYDKLQYPFMTETLGTRSKGKSPQHGEGFYENPTGKIIVHDRGL